MTSELDSLANRVNELATRTPLACTDILVGMRWQLEMMQLMVQLMQYNVKPLRADQG